MITQAEIKARFVYEPCTGFFRFAVDVRAGRNKAFLKARAGEVAGNYNPTTGYWYLSVAGKRYAAHRAAFVYMTGSAPTDDVDHINGDRLDNRWANLRAVTRAQNMQNIRKPFAGNVTGFLGVERKRNRFAARICVNGRKTSLGVYDTPAEAHEAYVQAKRRMHQWGTV